jgi:hypothetical protein
MSPDCCRHQFATASTLRRQPATTCAPPAAAATQIVAPLGDGNTTRLPLSTRDIAAGDNNASAAAPVGPHST